MADEDVKKEEKKAEKEAEAEAKLEKESSEEEAGSNADEEAQPEAVAEEATQTSEETPAEVEAVNVDSETAKEATKEASKEEAKEEKSEEKKAAPTSDESESRPESVGKEKKEVKKPEPTGKPALPTGRFKDLIKEIEGLTTIELAELVKALEERFGVSAAAPVVAAPISGAAGVDAAPEEEEKAIYTVVLTDSGAQKIAVIKALREINQELGLKEAKDIADAPPKEILKEVPKEKAEEAKKKLETAGAKVELK